MLFRSAAEVYHQPDFLLDIKKQEVLVMPSWTKMFFCLYIVLMFKINPLRLSIFILS